MHKSQNTIPQYSIHKGWIKLITLIATEYKLDIKNYFPEGTGVNHLANDYDVRQFRDIHWKMADDCTDNLFSVKAAKNVYPLTFGYYSLLLWTAPDLQTLLRDACEFSVILGSPMRMSLNEIVNGDIEIWFMNNEPLNKESHVSYIGVALYIATIMTIIQKATNNQLSPIKVSLHIWPYSNIPIEPFEKLLNCSITAGSPVRKLIFSHQELSTKLASSDPEIYADTKIKVRVQKANLESTDIISQIYKALDSLPNLVDESGPTICKLMLMSNRTMHRRLEKVNTCYRDVLEKYKLEKALQLLNIPNIMMAEIAFQLGFSDLSSFSRAFKRWSGLSPSQYRDHH